MNKLDRLNKFNKLEEYIDMSRINELLGKKEEEKKKCNTVLWVFAVIGAVAAVAGIAYAVYRYMTPDYLDDFDDEFDDDFEDDFFDDEEDEEQEPAKENEYTTVK